MSIPYTGTHPGRMALAAIVIFCFFVFLDVRQARPDLIHSLKLWLLHFLHF